MPLHFGMAFLSINQTMPIKTELNLLGLIKLLMESGDLIWLLNLGHIKTIQSLERIIINFGNF